MLANLHNLFNPAAVAQSLAPMPPLQSTIMDTFFKSRPNHPLPQIGLTELTQVARTVPVVRRDGTPLSLGNDEMETSYFAPLPIKIKVPITASELNDLRGFLGNTVSLEAWRANKLDYIRKTMRNTTEGMSTTVLTTGKLAWPTQLEGGRIQNYEIEYGTPLAHTPDEVLTATTDLRGLYKLLRAMELKVRMAGLGGKIEFWAGSDVSLTLLEIMDAYTSRIDSAPYRLELGQGRISVGAYTIHFMDETHPDPLSGEWLPKLNPKVLMAVATDVPGSVFYCAIDSVSANNAAVPLHIVPVKRDDDTGMTLIAQSKPVPVRSPKAVCLCAAVA